MSDLIKRPVQLPKTTEKLQEFIIVGKARLNAFRAKLRAIEKLDIVGTVRQAALVDTQDLADYLLDVEAQLGKILAARPTTSAYEGTSRPLPEGINKKQSHYAQKLNSPEGRKAIESIKAEAREKQFIPTAEKVLKKLSPAHVSHNSGDNEWYTPPEYVEAAREVMGGIDLDPASTEEANTVVKAERYFTAEDNGLIQPWVGRIWLNPPYASDLIHEFITKLCGVSDSIIAACVLVNNATETQWFQLLAGFSAAVAFPKGRVKFWHPTKVSVPLQGQAVLYVGDKTELFLDTFSKFGVVCEIR